MGNKQTSEIVRLKTMEDSLKKEFTSPEGDLKQKELSEAFEDLKARLRGDLMCKYKNHIKECAKQEVDKINYYVDYFEMSLKLQLEISKNIEIMYEEYEEEKKEILRIVGEKYKKCFIKQFINKESVKSLIATYAPWIDDHLANILERPNSLTLQENMRFYTISDNFGIFNIKGGEKIMNRYLSFKFQQNVSSLIDVYICSIIDSHKSANVFLRSQAVTNMAINIVLKYSLRAPTVELIISQFEIPYQTINNLKENWNELLLKEKLDVYIMAYIILSDSFTYFEPSSSLSLFDDSNSFKYHPICRQSLRQLSKEFPVFSSEKDYFFSKFSTNPFLIIKKIEHFSANMFSNFYTSDEKIDLSHFFDKFEYPDKNIFIDSFYLEKLSDSHSSNVTILISGFCSWGSNHKEDWEEYIKAYPESCCYTLIWPASSLTNVFYNVSGYIPEFTNLSRRTAYKERLLGLSTHFTSHYHIALDAGKALSRAISDGLFQNSCVSIVAFSLGCSLSLSCLQELAKEERKLIHDCVFLGAAIPAGRAGELRDIKEKAVAGMMVNVYDEEDYVLKHMYRLFDSDGAIGSLNIEGIDNVNATGIANGHLGYRKSFKKIFHRINDY